VFGKEFPRDELYASYEKLLVKRKPNKLWKLTDFIKEEISQLLTS